MNEFDEKNPDMEPEVVFPRKTGPDVPGGDATSDVFSADSINRNASAGGTYHYGRGDLPASDPEPEQPQPSPAQDFEEIPRSAPEEPERPAASAAPEADRQARGAYQERPYYPYGGQARQEEARRAPGGDYYRNVYSNAGGSANQNPYPYANRQDYAYPGEPPKKKGGAGKAVFAVLIVLLVLLIGGGVWLGVSGRLFSVTPRQQGSEPETEAIDNVDELVTSSTPDTKPVSAVDAMLPGDIYKKALPSSVGILVYDGNSRSLASEGSGVIFKEDNDGRYTYIVTCAHVISDRGVSVMVQLYDEKEYSAQIVGYDSKTDIGVLRIEEKGLTPCEIGDSSKLRVGDSVYAIGNPGGTEFANSFTNGMISAIDRPVSSSSTGYTMECIQHTAAINPGNSGGALLNDYGQVIGINSMKIVADDYEGMGFSVPSSVFVDIVNEVISHGYVTNRPKIGITYIPASSEQAYAIFVGIKGLPAGSIIVYSISADSSLADTDLKKGDMIVAVNGKDLKTSSDLAEIVEKSRVGDQLRLSIVRINSDYSYEEFEVTATLVEDKGEPLDDAEETTTSYFDDYFGNRENEGGSGGYSDDFFNDFFDRFFSNP